jgi:hypothetical protein
MGDTVSALSVGLPTPKAGVLVDPVMESAC